MRDAINQFRDFIQLDRKHRAEGLTSVEVERWSALKRRFEQQFSPDLSDERAGERASLRVPTRLRVDFPSVAALRNQRMTNLSRGGLFVATNHLLDIGTKVTLLLGVGSGSERLEVPAEVVSHNVGPRFAVDPPGMGLRFLEMPAETKRALETLYETSLEQATIRSAAD